MAKGSRGGRRGGGGGNAQPVAPTTPTTPVAPNQDLVDYLTRTQTVANSPEMAMKNTNPHYSESKDYQENCQRCVWAYELQRRGYNVEALPTYKGDDLPRNGNWKGLSKNSSDWRNNEFISGKNYKQEITNINNTMNNWGDGSRAIVRVVWKGGRTGHVFNIENHGGKIKAYDGQTGKNVDLNDYLSRTQRGYTFLLRTDNADIDMSQVSRYVKLGGK